MEKYLFKNIYIDICTVDTDIHYLQTLHKNTKYFLFILTFVGNNILRKYKVQHVLNLLYYLCVVCYIKIVLYFCQAQGPLR